MQPAASVRSRSPIETLEIAVSRVPTAVTGFRYAPLPSYSVGRRSALNRRNCSTFTENPVVDTNDQRVAPT